MAEDSLIILDDYQSASSKLADWSNLVDSKNSKVPITTLTTSITATDKVVETLLPFTMVHVMRERTKFPREVLERLPNLKLITTTGTRNAGIDMQAAKELGIIVSGTFPKSGYHASSGTVEQTWALILALARRLIPELNSVKSSTNPGWQTGIATGLDGKTLGLIGLGRLGKAVAVVAKAFKMNVQAWSPHLDEQRAAEASVKLAPSLEALMSTSDVVSLHLVLGPSTKNLVRSTHLNLLKPGAILVNTSRGPLINERDLIDYVKKTNEEGRGGGVGLDVFDVEPLPEDHPLRTLDNVVLSPHMGYVDDTCYNEWWPQTVENVQAYLKGEPIRVLNQ